MKKYIAALLALLMLLSFTACGGKDEGEDVTGKYLCVGEAYGDNPYSPPFDESWLELKKGGKGKFLSGLELDLKWELDGENFAGTVTFLGMEDTMTGTLKNGVIEVTYADKRIQFVKEGAEVPLDAGDESSTSAETQGSAAVLETYDFDAVTLAGSIEDAFAGYAASGFVSPTATIEMGSKWFGVMEFTNFVGAEAEDYAENVMARFGETSDGRAFFEINPGMEIDSDKVELSLYVELYDDHFEADIGNDDAWLFVRYLVEDEEQYFSPSLDNGALEIWYDYVHPTDGYSCTVHFFLREYGAPWDEASDPLPPSYDEYVASMVG